MPRYVKNAETFDVRIEGTIVQGTKYKNAGIACAKFRQAVIGAKERGFVHASTGHTPIENLDLEAAIVDAPDDDAPRIVYGDWLEEHGDPRGELVGIHRALATADDKKTLALKKREAKLFDKHGSIWWGPLDELLHERDYRQRPAVAARWRLGFFDTLEVRLGEDAVVELGATIAMVAKLASARFVRRLVLGAATWYQVALEQVVAGWPATLRELSITESPKGARMGSLSGVMAAHPKLESVALNIDDDAIEPLDLPAARRLELVTSRLAQKQIVALVASSFPRVETFELWIGYRAGLEPNALAPLFVPALFPALTKLRLGLASPGHAIILRSSPLFPQLRELTLLDARRDAIDAFRIALAGAQIKFATRTT